MTETKPWPAGHEQWGAAYDAARCPFLDRDSPPPQRQPTTEKPQRAAKKELTVDEVNDLLEQAGRTRR